jgi:hypothetical protein
MATTQTQQPNNVHENHKKGLWKRLKSKFHTKQVEPADVERLFPTLFGRGGTAANTRARQNGSSGNLIAALPTNPQEQRRLATTILAELDEYERLQRMGTYRSLPPLRFHVRVVRNMNGQTQRVHAVLNGTQLREKLTRLLNTPMDGRAAQNLFAELAVGGTTTTTQKPVKKVADVNAYPSYKYDGEPLPDDKKTCAICLADYEVDEEIRLLPCVHFYHKECIDTWLARSCVCPLCKSTIE